MFGHGARGNDVAACDQGFAEAQFLVWWNGEVPVADRAAQRPERAVAGDRGGGAASAHSITRT